MTTPAGVGPGGNGYPALHKARLHQAAGIGGDMLGIQTGENGDLFGRTVVMSDGPQDGDVVVQITEKVLQQQAWFIVQQAGGGEELPSHVFVEGQVGIKALPVGGDTAQHTIQGDPVLGAVLGEELLSCSKWQGQQLQHRACPTVEWRLVGDHMALHHA
ncbi:MAG: hypothetical protein PVF74_06075 [Anaerolineales bacterium]